ncbi:MAG: caspase family protein [Candidatus Cloacimonas sp.]|jgi:hypothetical protein|nr:caspase family protein [Candidatus Cloacimonas sp.]
MKKLIVVSLILAVSVMAFGARKALVIGNARYADKPLRNPVNDANLMSSTLGQLKFSVTKLTDVNYRAFNNAIRDFANNLEVEDEVVFYYSGHGVQISGENYLLPVGETFEDESDFEAKAIDLNWITAKLNSTAITMVFLDACRDNPFSKYRSGAKGLAMASGGNNSFIMYSTEAGSVANDGKGKNSDFTFCLSNELQKPGLCLDDISTNVTAQVRDLTDNAQRPWKIGSLSYKYYFTDPDFGKTSPSDHYAYSGRSSSSYSGNRRSSTVEERMNHKGNVDTDYHPKASNYLNVLSATEMLQQNFNDDIIGRGQFITRNTFGLKLKIAGVEGSYNVIKTWESGDFASGKLINQMGVGAGFTNPETIRLFVSATQNDLSEFSPYENYMGFKGELAKRVRSEKQFTEIGGSAEMNYIPDKLQPAIMHPISSYFEPSMLDWTPNKRYSAYVIASSLNNRYLEPNNFRGLGSASSPLMLANCQANAIIVRATMEERETNFRNNRTLQIDLQVPLNFNKYLGVDLGYRYNRLDDWDTNSMSQSTDIVGGIRFAPICFNNVRIIGCAEYDRFKTEESTEYLDFSGNLILKLTHHFALMGIIKHRSIWLRDEGFAELDPQSYIFGSSITVRL